MISISFYSLAIFPLTRNITKYNNYLQEQDIAYKECASILKESHLVYFREDDSEISFEDSFKKQVTYKINNEHYDEDGNYRDMFCYFYVTYNNEHIHFDNKSKLHDIAWVNKEVYKYESHQDIFALKDNDINLPMSFSEEYTKYLKLYLDGEINSKSEKRYEEVWDIYEEAFNSAADYIADSDDYQKASSDFNRYSNKMFSIVSYSSLIFYTVLFILYFAIVPLFFKKGQTLSKKILHIGLFYEDHTPIKNKDLFLRVFLQYIFYFFMLIFTPLLSIGTGVFYLPLFSIGTTTYYVITLALICFVFSFISMIFMFANINHRALHDKALNIYVLNDAPEDISDKEIKPDNVIEQENFDRGS